MISNKYKSIFVHIPKTGGTSVERLIWPLDSDRCEENLCKGLVDRYHNKYQTGGLQHLKASQIRTEVGAEVFNEYYKFSVVRNPWDKAVSQYAYMQKRRDLRMFLGMWKWTSFKKYLARIPKKTHVQLEKQHLFLTDANGELMVDKVLRFEELEAGMFTISEHLELENRELPHLKKSQREHYSTYYDTESVEMVAELYKEDIELFNYSYKEE